MNVEDTATPAACPPDAESPARPAAESPERRGFLVWLSVAFAAATSLAIGLPIVGFLLGPLLRKRPDEWVDLGPVASFPAQSTRLATFLNPERGPWDGMNARTAAYVRRHQGENFEVFAVNCTHLGCPVTWFQESGLFLCPCHGGAYYADGERASGPPPRALYRYPHRVRSGRLEVRAGHLPTLQDPLSGEAMI